MPRFPALYVGLFLAILGTAAAGRSADSPLPRVRVAADGKGFILDGPQGRPFVPWGFNYDHDRDGRLIEDYWEAEWPKVAEDFAEMRQLGANVVRVHLQFGKFMEAPDRPRAASLDRLGKLLDLAQRTGLHLDLTGLGCYHKRDVPAWYDDLDEAGRWAAQARFWDAVAGRCAGHTAVFCYNLMNEPVVPGGKNPPRQWLGPPFGDKHFVQWIATDRADRPRPAIARQWIRALAAAIRRRDPQALITVGLVDWSLDRPGLTSGFVPKEIVGELDFLCVHLYPEAGKAPAALETLAGFAVGKPVVIEETFPLRCGAAEFEQFLAGARRTAAGCIGFYWGKTPAECRQSNTIADALMLQWLECFERRPFAWGTTPPKR